MNNSTQELRRAFIRYFELHGHQAVPSSALIPQADPTLLFTNAGMNQFKRVFLGEDTRAYKRAVSVQKCLRAGGKHNDLENVGYTRRHHTFFEMLGNFSFGDYFKEDAIRFGWEFLTQTVGLDKDRMWVTVFREDDEADRLWKKMGVSPSRIVRCGEKDNFWQMGDTGPCGPCSELHFDQGPSVPGDDRPNGEGDRVIEIWNLVFMQFNRDAPGRYIPYPSPASIRAWDWSGWQPSPKVSTATMMVMYLHRCSAPWPPGPGFGMGDRIVLIGRCVWSRTIFARSRS